MNERIRLLAKQAKLKTELWNNPEPFVIYKEDVNYPGGLEKFAELLVKECVKVAHPKLTDVGEWAAGMRLVQQRLKQHFGVEE